MKPIMERGIKVITNAGGWHARAHSVCPPLSLKLCTLPSARPGAGMNPLALKVAIEQMARDAGVPVPVVGVVVGGVNMQVSGIALCHFVSVVICASNSLRVAC